MDSLYTFPGLILAIAIASVLGAGIGNIIVAISVLYIPTYFRIVRGQTLSVKNELYVEAARSIGVKPSELLIKVCLPQCASIGCDYFFRECCGRDPHGSRFELYRPGIATPIHLIGY